METESRGESGRAPVLVVDDDRDSRELLCEVLARAGLRPLRAYNGKEALLLLRSRAPRLVVLDLAMPEVSGWEVLAAMKASEALRPVPVVVVAGRPLDASGLRRSDVTAYFQKPLDLDRFADVIASLCRKAGLTAHAEPRP